jgi:GNAT superfamily N-acetyltransferase
VQQEITDQRKWLDSLEIGVLDGSEIQEALGVLSRGMRDNPSHFAFFGEDRQIRERQLRALMAGAFAASDPSHALAARSEDGAIVGVCGMSAPGYCVPGLRHGMLLSALLSMGHRHDAQRRHWHLGPLAVDAHLQRMGVGTRLLQVSCARVDAAHEDAYLQTDKPENVSFCARFGFEVVGVEEVLGITNYIMLRRVEGGHA